MSNIFPPIASPYAVWYEQPKLISGFDCMHASKPVSRREYDKRKLRAKTTVLRTKVLTGTKLEQTTLKVPVHRGIRRRPRVEVTGKSSSILRSGSDAPLVFDISRSFRAFSLTCCDTINGESLCSHHREINLARDGAGVLSDALLSSIRHLSATVESILFRNGVATLLMNMCAWDSVQMYSK